jgi:hypothetical protein
MLSVSKFSTRLISIAGIFALAAANPASAATNLVKNGNFAIGAPQSGCVAGTTTLTDWTVSAGNIDIDSAAPGCSGIEAAQGKYFIDLTGSFAPSEDDVGAISQTITTVVGQEYRLSFYFGGNPQWQEFSYPNDSELKVMAVYLNGAISGVYSVHTAGVSVTDAQWRRHEIRFKATSTSTEITFQSLNGSASNPSDFGSLLDDVDVSPIKNGEDSDEAAAH